jgi:hypothetical protein
VLERNLHRTLTKAKENIMRHSSSMILVAALLCSGSGITLAQGNVNNGSPLAGTWRSQVPKGWTTGGNVELDYGTLLGGVPDGKRAAVLRARKKLTENEFGTIMQTISADAYRGRRARLSAMLSAEQSLSSGRIALWMRVNDASGKVAAIDNMETRTIAAGSGWKRYEIVLDVPQQAASISFGALLAGGGQGCCFGRVAVSDFRLEAVRSEVAVTTTPVETLPDAPVNADFSEQ